jgi:HSP20 family protein
MLMRFDPFRELDVLAEQLRGGTRARAMPMDAHRRGDASHADLDMPGETGGPIEITVEKNVMTVRAERRWDTEGVETVACERPQGTFSRELFLGENLDTEKIRATYEDGVLRLTIPVAEQAMPRRIEVQVSPKAEAIEATTVD